MKVAIICNIVVPYTIPTFNNLKAYSDLDVTVLYIAKEAGNRLWDSSQYEKIMEYKHLFLPGIKFKLSVKNEFAQYVINYSLLHHLYTQKYDVIITYGWFDFACQCVAFFHPFLGSRHIVWSDSTLLEESWIRKATRFFVEWFVCQADGCIASGVRARDYYRSLGVMPDRIHIAPSSIDEDVFSKSVARKRKNKEILRKKFQISPNATVFLFVGQFVQRKGVDILLQAVLKIQKKSKKKINVLLVGYGTELEEYQNFIRKNNLGDVFRILKAFGDDLYECYAVADVFVLPSREETWGLVINEALASGLPVILSSKVGSGPDTITHGKNGYIFQNENYTQLSGYMTKLCDRNIQKKMRKASLLRSKQLEPSKTAAGFRTAIIRSLET